MIQMKLTCGTVVEMPAQIIGRRGWLRLGMLREARIYGRF